MRFPPSFIERLRAHFLLSEVIGKRIAIKKHGREFQALCPFHNEKSPSFTINDEKGFFHCFGCSAHGDAIGFVMKYERLTYPEAIESLARDAGIPLPELTQAQEQKIAAEKTLYDVLEAACQWFEKQFSAAGGMQARDYIDRRGLTAETTRRFRIGYAPDERTGLLTHLKTAGFTEPLMFEAGLIIIPDEGSAYDRFRGRVMFPIRNASGKVIAFGGRLITTPANKNLPKYLNSPETPLFKKGELLFNLDQAKKPARDGNMVVVMEGYMDVVASSQAGIHYAVATLGTATTPEHLRLLWQLAKEPVLCLDGDAAGQRAMLRAAEIALPMLKAGFSLRFVTLPSGEDPDSYVQKHGKAAFESMIAAARRLSQVLWDNLSQQYPADSPEGKAALEGAFKKLAEAIADPTVKTHFSSYFRKMLWEKASPNTKTPPRPRSIQVEHMARGHHSPALDMLAQRLLTLLIVSPGLLHKSQVEESLSRLVMISPGLNQLRQVLLMGTEHTTLDNHPAFLDYVERHMQNTLYTVIGTQPDMAHHGKLSLTEAQSLWNEAMSAYDDERELITLEESIRREWSEAESQRLLELKQKRATRSFAPMEQDAV